MAQVSDSIVVDGCSMTVESLMSIGPKTQLSLSEDAWIAVRKSRAVVDTIVAEGRTVYGINTGFGNFSEVVIPPEKLSLLQENLIRSHAAGVGNTVTPERTKRLLALRINVLAKGAWFYTSSNAGSLLRRVLCVAPFLSLCSPANLSTHTLSRRLSSLSPAILSTLSDSPSSVIPFHSCLFLSFLGMSCLQFVPPVGYSGVGEETLRRLVAFFNKNCLSRGRDSVPEQGTLGASGDLAPLAHLALGMLGEGQMWHPETKELKSAASVIEEFGLTRLELGPKEGLALINGTQLISALGAEAIWRAQNLAVSADAITALTLEALQGTVTAYFPEIHKARPHAGQALSAKTMRCLLHSSIYPSVNAISHAGCKKVQDAYSLRCAPQVHGVVYDTIAFVRGIMETEMNSATDNPMVFSESGRIVSGGNFHGEYPSKALDYLAIAVHELANISERRVERLVNSTLSGLPAFLVEEGGLNSGFMIAHCTSAALVSENKTLAHPASVDSIPTSAEKEDHVSMGGWAARKCLLIVANVETVLAIEYLAAAQGLYLRRPLISTDPVEAIYNLLRDDAAVGPWGNDRYMNPDIEAARKLIEDRKLATTIQPFIHRWESLDPNQNYKYYPPTDEKPPTGDH